MLRRISQPSTLQEALAEPPKPPSISLGDDSYDDRRIGRWTQWPSLQHIPREFLDLNERVSRRRAELTRQHWHIDDPGEKTAAVEAALQQEMGLEIISFNKRTRAAETRHIRAKNSIYRDARKEMPDTDFYRLAYSPLRPGLTAGEIQQWTPWDYHLAFNSIDHQDELSQFLTRAAGQHGISQQEARDLFDRQVNHDWTNAPEHQTTRLLSDGRLLVRPDKWFHEEDYRKAVEGSGAPEDAQRLAMERFPELRRSAVEQRSAHILPSPDFQRWAHEETARDPLFARLNATDQTLRYLDQQTTADRILLGINTGIDEGIMLGGRAVYAGGAILGIDGAQDYVNQGNEALRISDEYAQAVDMDRGLSVLGVTPRNAASTLTAMAPGIAGGIATGGMSIPVFMAGLQAGGDTYAEVYADAIASGLTHEQAREAATTPALLTGVVSAVITRWGGPRGAEALIGAFNNPATRTAVVQTLRGRVFDAMKQSGLSFAREGLQGFREEALDSLVSDVVRHLSYDRHMDREFDVGSAVEKAMQSGVTGFALEGPLGGAAGGMKSWSSGNPTPASGGNVPGSASLPSLGVPAGSPPVRPSRPSDAAGPTWRGIGDQGQIVVLPASEAATVQEAMARLQGMLGNGQRLLRNVRYPRTAAEEADALQDAQISPQDRLEKMQPLMEGLPPGSPLREVIAQAAAQFDPASGLGVENFVRERLTRHLIDTGAIQPPTPAPPIAAQGGLMRVPPPPHGVMQADALRPGADGTQDWFALVNPRPRIPIQPLQVTADPHLTLGPEQTNGSTDLATVPEPVAANAEAEGVKSFGPFASIPPRFPVDGPSPVMGSQNLPPGPFISSSGAAPPTGSSGGGTLPLPPGGSGNANIPKPHEGVAEKLSASATSDSPSPQTENSSATSAGESISIEAEHGDVRVVAQRPRVYRPNRNYWIERGGEVVDHDDGRVTYIDWDGNRVTYTGNYPDFRSAGLVRQEVSIEMRGDRKWDFAEADRRAPLGPKLPRNVWHHHEDGTTMLEIDFDLHARFTHEGGVAVIKRTRRNLKNNEI